MNSDLKILKGCRKGDRKAQNQLYQKYKATLFGVCLRYSRSTAEAEDLLQEAFIRIFTDLYQYQPTGALGAWMRKVTVNVALQFLRRRKDFQLIPADHRFLQRYEPEFEVFEQNREEAILRMVQQLPDGYRLVFNLHVMEGYTHREIANKLSISENTSKSQLHRAKAALKVMVEKNMSTDR